MKSKEIVLRMICKADDGQMRMNGKENMTWEFIDNNAINLNKWHSIQIFILGRTQFRRWLQGIDITAALFPKTGYILT